MRALSALVALAAPDPARFATRLGPGPSILAYRVARTWAKPGVRSAVTLYLPIALIGAFGWRIVADDEIRASAEAEVAALWESVITRPEFRLTGVVITGAEARLQSEIHRLLALPVGQSSLRLDIEELRARVTALGGVKDASVSLDPAGLLHVEVTPRPAVAIWREGETLFRVAVDGTIIAPVSRRAAHPGMPVLIGEGALSAVGEALALMAQGPEVRDRLRAFVRVGARRWDLHLSGGLVIMLPAADPGMALARVLALNFGEEILDRDITHIDMRLPDRPTLRLPGGALETMRLRRAIAQVEAEDL
ncbi:MAG: cell division protein FtsQ/DivIB [Pseudomonadota bacterium]